MRLLFIDYSSVFNTIVPSKLITKLWTLGQKPLPLQLDPGLPDRLHPGGKGGQQHICHADPQNRGPSGCMLSPLLYSLFTHDCVTKHDSNTISKFADSSVS